MVLPPAAVVALVGKVPHAAVPLAAQLYVQLTPPAKLGNTSEKLAPLV
jgi:hypothetical protein